MERKLKVDEKGVLYIPKGTEVIKDKEFSGRGDIKKVVFPSSVKAVGIMSFSHCENLEEVVFPSDSICFLIAQGAFEKCYKMKKVVLPLALEEIGKFAFRDNRELKSLYVPIKTHMVREYAFANCYSLERLKFANPKISFYEFCIFECHRLFHLEIGDRVCHILPSFMYSGLCLFSRKCGEFIFYRMQRIAMCEKGNIIGDKYYVCFGPGGKFGEGDTVKEAYNDHVLFATREEQKEALKRTITSKDSKISLWEYRILSGSCLFGVKALCAKIDYPLDKIASLREMALIIEKNKWPERTIQAFLDFCNSLKEHD